MGRHADSKTKQKRKKAENLEKNIAKALEAYQAELKKPVGQRLGVRKIAAMYEGVTHATLSNRAAGGRSIQEFNATKHKLMEEDEKQLTALISLSSDRGLPFTREDIRRTANVLLRARCRSEVEPVGINWVYRYLERHHQELTSYWSKHLDVQRADCLNPTAVREWFNIVEQEIVKKRIPPERIFGMDESGFPPANDAKFSVIGAAGKKIQPQRGGGNRENTTALVTICADGTCPKPVVIFKAKCIMSKWTNNNIADIK